VEFLVSAPCVVFEDEHLLVVNKPPGWNTHSPSEHHGEGIYDWLRHREPRWASLAIMHRLDKETSGLLVFSKTPLANRSLTNQFSERLVRKVYHLATDRAVKEDEFTVTSAIVRSGSQYCSRPVHAGADRAETHFRIRQRLPGLTHLEAEPVTGRTHQIRVHALDKGYPIFGDVLYGGTSAERLWLHSEQLQFRQPATLEPINFSVPANFEDAPAELLRLAIIDSKQTDAFRLVHGAADGCPAWYVDRLGDYLLSQSNAAVTPPQMRQLEKWSRRWAIRGVYHKLLTRQVGDKILHSPQRILGEAAPSRFLVRENDLKFELTFEEGYSVGLFLDQRDNRYRCLTRHVAADFPLLSEGAEDWQALNAFAYTCAFSVCAARAGARVTSLDLSKKYLDWGKRNFAVNGLVAEDHDFVYGDALDWLHRFAKKQRQFDLILLDPPTFSRTKEHGVFQAEKDMGRLTSAAVPLLKKNGILFVSTNAGRLQPDTFVTQIREAILKAKRPILQVHYQPQPPDFPVTRAEPAHLKTVWIRVG
jgi:23S rRNA (cytosine1962-C5)-methyltransferase